MEVAVFILLLLLLLTDVWIVEITCVLLLGSKEIPLVIKVDDIWVKLLILNDDDDEDDDWNDDVDDEVDMISSSLKQISWNLKENLAKLKFRLSLRAPKMLFEEWINFLFNSTYILFEGWFNSNKIRNTIFKGGWPF